MFVQDVKKTALRLHDDESAPTTVEWVLLIIVALVILVGIYAFTSWALGKLKDSGDAVIDGGDALQQDAEGLFEGG